MERTRRTGDQRLRQRIKYAQAHLSRKEHLALLSRPNWRKIRRVDPSIRMRPFAVSRAALRSRASKRIRVMAQPKFVTKKYDVSMAPAPYPYIHPKTLAAKSSRRVVELALPKRRYLVETMKLAATKNMKAIVNDLLVKVRKSRYQRYRVFCNARQEREARKKRKQMAKLRRALTKPEDWQRHMRVLERLAAPKIVKKPKKKRRIRKKKWRPINLERLDLLAQPRVYKMPMIRDPLVIEKKALTYRITRRIRNLAIREKPPEISPRMPGAVSSAALRAIASERIIALAKPAQRPAGLETDLREDAFTVSPMALKAKCSRRLKILARPKVYPKPVFKRMKTSFVRP